MLPLPYLERLCMLYALEMMRTDIPLDPEFPRRFFRVAANHPLLRSSNSYPYRRKGIPCIIQFVDGLTVPKNALTG